MNFLRGYIRLTNKIIDSIGFAISWLTAVLVLVVCFDVCTRYIFQKSFMAVQELQWHLFALIFLLGAASALRNNKHVRVDVIYSNRSDRFKAYVNLLGATIWLIPFSILIIWASQNFVLNSFSLRETSPNPGGLPGTYLLKASIPLAFFLLILQGISQIFSSILVLLDNSRKLPNS